MDLSLVRCYTVCKQLRQLRSQARALPNNVSRHLMFDCIPTVFANCDALSLSADLNGANIERDVTDWWKSSYRLSKSLEDGFPAAAQCAAQLREDTTAFREHLPVIQVWNMLSKEVARQNFVIWTREKRCKL